MGRMEEAKVSGWQGEGMAEPTLPSGKVYGRKAEDMGAPLYPSCRRWWVSSPPGLGFLKQAV